MPTFEQRTRIAVPAERLWRWHVATRALEGALRHVLGRGEKRP